MCAAVITQVLLARLLGGVSARGDLAAIQTVGGVIGSSGHLGIPDAVTYFWSKDSSYGKSLLRIGLRSVAVISAILFALGCLAISFALRAYPESVVHEAQVYATVIPFWLLLMLGWSALRAERLVYKWNVLRVAPMGTIALACSVLLVSDISVTPVLLSRMQLLVFAAFALFSWNLVWRRARQVADVQPGTFLTYALVAGCAGVLRDTNLWFGRVAVLFLYSSREVGLFSVATAWSSVFGPLLWVIGAVAFPRLATLEETSVRRFETGRFIGLTMSLALVLFVVLTWTTPVGIPLAFGRVFEAAVPLAAWLVPAALIGGVNDTLENVLRAFGAPRGIVVAEGAGFAAGIVSLRIWTQELDVAGVAGAVLSGQFVILILLCGAVWRVLDLSLSDVRWALAASSKSLFGAP